MRVPGLPIYRALCIHLFGTCRHRSEDLQSNSILQNLCLSIRLLRMFEQKWPEVFIFNSAAYFY